MTGGTVSDQGFRGGFDRSMRPVPVDVADAAPVLSTLQQWQQHLRDDQWQVDVPVVDEQETERLHRLADGVQTAGWTPWLFIRHGRAVGYVGWRSIDGPSGLPAERERSAAAAPVPNATVELALEPAAADPVDWARAGEMMVQGVASACAQQVDAAQVWIRAVTDAQHAELAKIGEVRRRLAILGLETKGLAKDLAAIDGRKVSRQAPAAFTVRPFDGTAREREMIVGVLAAAYEGTGEQGWDIQRFVQREDSDWFRAQDLLVAEETMGQVAQPARGAVVGIHWTKQRGQGIGEVYNLAVDPRHHGRGVGRALLAAGLEHLARQGCHRVVLWVDRSNNAAVTLYEQAGFVTIAHDVAVVYAGRQDH